MNLGEHAFSSEKRSDLAKKGFAQPDGSYPIVTVGDLKNAIKAFGRGGAKASDRTHIKKRAKALGATAELPEEWNEALSERFIEMLREAVDLGPGEVHAGPSSRECSPGTDLPAKKRKKRLPTSVKEKI